MKFTEYQVVATEDVNGNKFPLNNAPGNIQMGGVGYEQEPAEVSNVTANM